MIKELHFLRVTIKGDEITEFFHNGYRVADYDPKRKYYRCATISRNDGIGFDPTKVRGGFYESQMKTEIKRGKTQIRFEVLSDSLHNCQAEIRHALMLEAQRIQEYVNVLDKGWVTQ